MIDEKTGYLSHSVAKKKENNMKVIKTCEYLSIQNKLTLQVINSLGRETENIKKCECLKIKRAI